MPDAVPHQAKSGKVGFAGLFSRTFWFATIITGLMSALAQGLNYFLNTWLPVLMEQAGFNAKGSLAFLLVLSGGAIVGALAASRFADRLGPKPVVAMCFLIGGVFISLMTLELPLAVRLVFVAIVGLGTTGTSLLIYGLVANQFPTKMRGAAVAWAAGFGRLGGVSGPLLGGFVLAAGLSVDSIFYVLTGLAVVGVVLTLLVPRAHVADDTTPAERAVPAGTAAGSSTR
jgi:AAHS family benzoate transporter-like MFS transporter